jgi:hypothetical protein
MVLGFRKGSDIGPRNALGESGRLLTLCRHMRIDPYYTNSVAAVI